MSQSDDTRFPRLRSAASATTSLASAWTSAKTAALKHRAHRLQAELDSPDSWAESGGHAGEDDRFQTRRAVRDQLRAYHDVRLDGGIVATLLEARALMVFGVGGEFTAETDAVADWLNDQFDQQDLLTLDIGTDALFYGYSLGEIRETQAGEFGKVEFIEPWTTVPKVSNKGEILSWEQEVDHHDGQRHSQEFDPDDILHFNVMRSSGRDSVGMSMLGRAMTEAESYRDHQDAIDNAMNLHAFPKWHIKLGRDGGAVIDDNELRRARPMFDDINELTKWVTGQDVDIDVISPETFEFEGITEHDLSKLAIAFMLPVELTQITGGDGLGTGFPARLRERLFLLSAYAQQNQLAGQLVDQVGKHLIREYAPEDVRAIVADAAGGEEDALGAFDLRYEFDEPITDLEDLREQVNAVGDDMTVNERRNLFGLPPVDDESVGGDFEAPGKTDPEGFGDDGGGGGESLFADSHDLADPMVNGHQFDPGEGTIYCENADEQWDGETFDDIGGDCPHCGQAMTVFDDHDLAEREDFWWEDAIETMSERAWAEETDHALFGFSEGETPAFVKARLFEAVLEGSPIFSDVESIPSSELMDFRLYMAETLTEDGWTITEMTDELMSRFDIDDEQRAETVARSTTQNMVSEAAEDGYRQREDFEDLRFRWAGPTDHRTSDVCLAIEDAVPDEGLPLDDLQALVETEADEHDLRARGWTPHPNCRHRPVRVVD